MRKFLNENVTYIWNLTPETLQSILDGEPCIAWPNGQEIRLRYDGEPAKIVKHSDGPTINAPGQPDADGWIKTSERLPDEADNPDGVLVVNRYGSIRFFRAMAVFPDESPYWHPLPKPPATPQPWSKTYALYKAVEFIENACEKVDRQLLDKLRETLKTQEGKLVDPPDAMRRAAEILREVMNDDSMAHHLASKLEYRAREYDDGRGL